MSIATQILGAPEALDHFQANSYSPYNFFSSEEWAKFRADTPLTLTGEEVARLRSMGDPIDLDEVRRIYLSLSRLLSSHVESSQLLFEQRNRFLSLSDVTKTPFVIGIAGSVAVGKSTTARVLKELLRRWPSSPKVDLITTDGFLHPNAVLERENLMQRKGFPESYDTGAILKFLSAIKAGQPNVKAPVYSHLVYDVVPNEYTVIDRPDILVFEGINVLQSRDLPADGKIVPMVSDFFDFSIYIDAEEKLINNWYVARFMRLRETAFRDPNSYFHRYASISDEEALSTAEGLWANINLKNLRQNILPTRPRADLILRKGPNHLIEQVALRKL
ncbi:type I pantothenate kinase [Rhizobium sp. P32RR-XVIII]|uniref:type I pantothenate kinase n=1 Tax=Rhizobium sp. P32RR-XVIII TaxID=2726738 RepID=UPI0014573764|nr:type I pantothenate kinase [Rhizobium sp. P32RR-XVIII]NLS05914.1 type I pantothenate kinase [Rhizobium sp. P32RR-XVIII]